MYILNDGVIYILTDDMDLSSLEDPPLEVDEFRAASLNGYIYAVGGFDIERDTSPCLRAVQRYDPSTDKWQLMAEMSTARASFGLAADDHYLCVIGGRNGNDGALNSAERYDPLTDTWMALPSMNIARTCSKAFACGGFVLVCTDVERGHDDCSWQLYSTQDNAWYDFSTLAFPHTDYKLLNAAVFDNNFYLFCKDKTKSSDSESVFCFLHCNAKTGDWKQDRLLKTSFHVNPAWTVHGSPYYFRKTLTQKGCAVGY